MRKVYLLTIIGLIVFGTLTSLSTNASSTLLQLNGLTSPGSIASNQTLTLNWDASLFGASDKTLQFYACYNSSSNSLIDTGRCKSLRWPTTLNSGNAQISLTDSMIPTPGDCHRDLQNFVIGIADPLASSTKAISSKVSITGIKAETVCPASAILEKSSTITSVWTYSNIWPVGSDQTIAWDGLSTDYLEVWLCTQSNRSVNPQVSIAFAANNYCRIRLVSNLNNYNHNRTITVPSNIPAGTYYLYLRKMGDTSNTYSGNVFSWDPVTVTGAQAPTLIRTVSLDNNVWIGGMTNTLIINGTSLNTRPDLRISVCHPVNQTVCSGDFASYTYDSCSNDGTSCRVTTSAIGPNLAANHPEYFSNGQAKLRVSGANVVVYSPLFYYYPSGYTVPATPINLTTTPYVSTVNVVDGTWTGGTTHTIGVTGANLESKPALILRICNPSGTTCTNQINYSDYTCKSESCMLEAGPIGPKLSENNPQFFASDKKTSALKVCIVNTSQCSYGSFIYNPASVIPTTPTTETPIWNGPKVTQLDINSLRAYGVTGGPVDYYYLYGGDIVSVVVSRSGFANNLTLENLGITRTAAISATDFNNANNCVNNVALFLCNPDTTGNSERCSRINTSVGTRVWCGTGTGSCDNANITIGFKMPARVASNDPVVAPYFRSSDGATRIKVCPVAYPVNFSTFSSVGSEYIVEGYNNDACAYSKPFRLKDYNLGEDFGLPAGAGCYKGECVCVNGVRKTCSSPWGSGAECPASSSNYPNGICSSVTLKDQLLASPLKPIIDLFNKIKSF